MQLSSLWQDFGLHHSVLIQTFPLCLAHDYSLQAWYIVYCVQNHQLHAHRAVFASFRQPQRPPRCVVAPSPRMETPRKETKWGQETTTLHILFDWYSRMIKGGKFLCYFSPLCSNAFIVVSHARFRAKNWWVISWILELLIMPIWVSFWGTHAIQIPEGVNALLSAMEAAICGRACTSTCMVPDFRRFFVPFSESQLPECRILSF